MPKQFQSQEEAVKTIAKNILGFETLETRKSDSLDFKEVAVWNVKEALEAAFEAGRNSKKG